MKPTNKSHVDLWVEHETLGLGKPSRYLVFRRVLKKKRRKRKNCLA